MRKNKRYRHWIIRNADILERKESGTVRRRKKKRIMIGEKVIGAGFRFDEKAIVHLKSDGSYQMVRYKANDIESWQVFSSLMVVWNHIQKYK